MFYLNKKILKPYRYRGDTYQTIYIYLFIITVYIYIYIYIYIKQPQGF